MSDHGKLARCTHPNHSYILHLARKVAGESPGARILDYGCGAGEVVQTGRGLGLEMFGADAFYAGGSRKAQVEQAGLLGSVVREMRDGKLDFEDRYFDLVVSNEVFEHVENLEVTLHEIDRVLVDDGVLLCLFPSREVIREGHIGIPLAHRFPKGSALRYVYTLALRSAGLGYWKQNKSRREWVRDELAWLDTYTVVNAGPELSQNRRPKSEPPTDPPSLPSPPCPCP